MKHFCLRLAPKVDMTHARGNMLKVLGHSEVRWGTTEREGEVGLTVLFSIQLVKSTSGYHSKVVSRNGAYAHNCWFIREGKTSTGMDLPFAKICGGTILLSSLKPAPRLRSLPRTTIYLMEPSLLSEEGSSGWREAYNFSDQRDRIWASGLAFPWVRGLCLQIMTILPPFSCCSFKYPLKCCSWGQETPPTMFQRGFGAAVGGVRWESWAPKVEVLACKCSSGSKPSPASCMNWGKESR